MLSFMFRFMFAKICFEKNQERKIHVMFIDKHNMNLSVLIFLKTYVCKHESKHER